jgi:NTE family protein
MLIRLFSFIFTYSFFFSCTLVHAQQQPKIGLVLSGGGAKGAAHIGVLRVLEQNHVPIDYIVGTSIGAYVAGLYALGYSVDEIESIMLTLPWDSSYSDFIPRESLLYADKQLRDRYNITLRLGYSDGHLKMPSGLLLGQTAGQLLRESTDVIGTFKSFDNLAIPYRAVAANLVTAKAVVLDAGSITQAMRASASVPGVIEPVIIDGQILVDGGIVNNLPVDVVRNMGADIIIAVDIGSSLSKQEDIKDTIDVVNQLSTILTNSTTIKQKNNLTSTDILIRPAIDDLSTTDFSIMPEALALGEMSSIKQLDKIQTLSVDPREYSQYVKRKKQKSALWFGPVSDPIIKVEYDNASKVNRSIIEKHFAIKAGDVVTKVMLKKAIDRVFALDKFEQVSAEFVAAEQGRILVLTTKAKSWGPNYLKFGGSLQTDFSSDTFIELNFGHLFTDITENGGIWKNELSVGWESMVATEFYQPIDTNQKFYSLSRLEYAQDKWAKSQNRPELSNRYIQTKLGLGFNYVGKGILEVGFIGEKGKLDFEISNDRFEYQSVGTYFTLGFDDLNSINFPTKGNKFSLDVYWLKDEYDENLGQASRDQSIEIKFNWRGALGLGNHTFVGITSLATVDSDNDLSVHVSELGGFLNLSGYKKDALIGAHKIFAAVVYQYDLGREVPGASGLPMYLGTSLEVGNIWALNDSVSTSDLITSGSLYLSTDTSFGPAAIGVGYASDGETTMFLSIGKNW